MDFESGIDEMIEKLTTFENDLESKSNKTDLLKWINEISELNKEVALKTECTKVFRLNCEKDAEASEKDIQTHLMKQQKIKDICKELKKDIKEIDTIRAKTEKNHIERMEKIQNNYDEVNIKLYPLIRFNSKDCN